MIQSLYIRNYLLIDQLELDFSSGFITITGETGAGKSILMGALSLILGQRVDTSVLKLKDAKCIVEGSFRTGQKLEAIFTANDIDYEPVSTLRREIAPGGKSRAFVNDTPVNLAVLKELGKHLVDIHSQHQNLQLNDHSYQMDVINYLASNRMELNDYRLSFESYCRLKSELDKTRKEASLLKEELDYMQFQYDELKSAALKDGEMDELEADLQRAEHAGEISAALQESTQNLFADENGILDMLRSLLSQLKKIAPLYGPAEELSDRMESAYIELKDLSAELEDLSGRSDMEPGSLEHLRERVDLIFGLMQKHRVKSAEELIALREDLNARIEKVVFSDETIAAMEQEFGELRLTLESKSDILHKQRRKAGDVMQEQIEKQLRLLGIPNAKFKLKLERLQEFDADGADRITFLFSANKQLPMEDLSRVASGGEVSRLMLSIKSMVSDRQGMPTLVFDEIDTGVSGEIADKVGTIMDTLASGRQVIAITHLPQVASKGAEQFVVYKEDTSTATYTRMKKLTQDERVTEIAKMLSGEELSDAALSNARILLRI